MPINLRDEKLLNQYIERLVYHGGEYKPFQPSQMKDKDFIEANQETIISAMTYQWMKTRVREYLTDKEGAPFCQESPKPKKMIKTGCEKP